MILLDTTIVSIAIPSMVRGLHTDLNSVVWVLSVYLLTYAVPMLFTSRLGDRFGPKRVFLAGLIVFTGASLWCGLSGNVEMLIAARAVQGLGAALMTPQTLAFITHLFPPAKRGPAMGMWGGVAGLATIAGPLLGGVLVDHFGWEWIFYVNVPIGVIAVIAALRTLPSVKPSKAEALDVRGLVLMSAGLALITYGLAEIGTTGSFTSVKVLVPLVVGLALVALFAVHALRVPRPLLDLRLFRRPTFSAASIAMFFLAAALFGGMILLPLYWQQIRFESVVKTGLLTAPMGLGMALVMPFAGRLADRLGGGPLALAGVIVTTLATIPFGLIGAHTSIPAARGVRAKR